MNRAFFWLFFIWIGQDSSSKSFAIGRDPIFICYDSIPDLNQSVLNFVNSRMNKKVGRGECWDLISEALNAGGAKWDQQYKYGKELRVRIDSIYAGDIIQFKDVLLQYELNGSTYKEYMDHHTAIIYQVISFGNYILAHQNTEFSGKKVGLSPFNRNDLSRGKIKIYRPVRE